MILWRGVEMFGRKKMYKKGLADAMQAYEAFGRKQEAALEHMREEVRKGNQQLETALSDLGEDLNGIYDHLTSQEKAALYHLSTPMDIKEMEDEEKRLLLAVLYQLAFDEGDGVTDSQRGYIRSVQKYLEITNPQTEAELFAVGDVDSLETQKAFLQVVLEFLYLQDSAELSDEQEDFLGYFSVNRKQAALIEERVSRLFNAVGDKGIAEKYGYVPEKDELEADCAEISYADNQSNLYDNPTFNSALYYFMQELKKGWEPYAFETKDYLITYLSSYDTVIRLNKNTGEKSDLYYHDSFPSAYVSSWYKIIDNTIFFDPANEMAFDAETLEPPVCLFRTSPSQSMDSWSVSGKWLAYQQSLDLCVRLFDVENKCEIPVSYDNLPLYAKFCVLSGDKVIFLGEEYRNCRYFKDAIFSYDIPQKKLSKLCESKMHSYAGDFMTIYSDNLIIYKIDYSQQCAHLYYKSLMNISASWALFANFPHYETCQVQKYEDGILHTSEQNPGELYFIDFKNLQKIRIASSVDGKQYSGEITFTKVGRTVYYLEGNSLYRTSIDNPSNPVLAFSESN